MNSLSEGYIYLLDKVIEGAKTTSYSERDLTHRSVL